jgi:hypothetical protein
VSPTLPLAASDPSGSRIRKEMLVRRAAESGPGLVLNEHYRSAGGGGGGRGLGRHGAGLAATLPLTGASQLRLGRQMAKSNAAGLIIPTQAQRQLRALLKNLDRMQEILAHSRDTQPGVTAYEVLEPLAEKLNIDHDDLLNIFYSLENLNRLAAEYGTASEALDRIIAGTDPALSKQLRESEPQILAILTNYRGDHPVALSFKAQKLVYLHERIYRDAEILTDVRPIFDDAADGVLGAIIGHTLSITFTRMAANERLHIAMDAGDVLALRKACDRAIRKAKVLQESLTSSNLNWYVHVLRGGDNGSG